MTMNKPIIGPGTLNVSPQDKFDSLIIQHVTGLATQSSARHPEGVLAEINTILMLVQGDISDAENDAIEKLIQQGVTELAQAKPVPKNAPDYDVQHFWAVKKRTSALMYLVQASKLLVRSLNDNEILKPKRRGGTK